MVFSQKVVEVSGTRQKTAKKNRLSAFGQEPAMATMRVGVTRNSRKFLFYDTE